MSPHHVAEESDGDHTADKRSRTKKPLPGKDRENGGNNAEAGKNGNVNFGMAKEPKQVLPEQRRTAGMSQHLIIHHKAGRN